LYYTRLEIICLENHPAYATPLVLLAKYPANAGANPCP